MFLIVSDNRLALLIAHPCFISSIAEIFIYKMFNVLLKHRPHPGEGGRGYSQKNWVGVCGQLPKTLTLFMTKFCDFPYPIYDLAKNFIPYL